MTALPEPQPGLVISYAYLWSDEAERGLVEGRKDRPRAIIIAIAIEIPRRVKEHLGSGGERSWIVLDEFNVFTWPGFDLRPIKDRAVAAWTTDFSRRSSSQA